MKRAWIGTGLLAVLWLLVGGTLSGQTGVVRSTSGADHRELDVQRTPTIDLAGLDPIISSGGVSIRWSGVWDVSSPGLYTLQLDTHGTSSWTIDGHPVVVLGEGQAEPDQTVLLNGGFHAFEITYEPNAEPALLKASAGRAGQPTQPFDSFAIKPRPPRNPRLRSVGVTVRFALGLTLVVALIVAVRRTAVALWPHPRESSARAAPAVRRWWWPGLRRALAGLALVVIIGYGALLRLDAITGRYGVVTTPAWLAHVQTRRVLPPAAIRPAVFDWQPVQLFPHQDGHSTRYMSDPYTYLDYGRSMRSFYAAHRREPLFPFMTRTSLRWLGNQDVAVSFASTVSSLLAIWFTYLFGAALWSRAAGLAAAFGLAIDYDVISLAASGWRDDAFMAGTVLCAYLMLRCYQVRFETLSAKAPWINAILLGVGAGLTCLVRMTAISFLVPAAVFLFVTLPMSWRRRWLVVGLASVTAVAVVGPFLFNCWRVYGDPLYSVNVHTSVYELAEGQRETGGSALGYVGDRLVTRPAETVQTIATGLTSYPFDSKWHGLDPWVQGAGTWASYAALVGLLVLATWPRGRLALLVLVTSLVPFAATWQIGGDWRFTAHAYPFFLVAAAIAVSWLANAAFGLLVPPSRHMDGRLPGGRHPVLTWAGVLTLVALGFWATQTVLPTLAFREALAAGDDVTAMAGSRDRGFFRSGWSEVFGTGNVRMRVATREATLRVRLPRIDDYPMTIRLDPFPQPRSAVPTRVQTMEVALNGTTVSQVRIQWTPGRVGSYNLVLPRSAVRSGSNDLRFRTGGGGVGDDSIEPGVSEGSAFAVWYVRVHPPAAPGR